MANHDTLMKRIAWTAATIWLTIDATVAVEATRQSEHRIVEIPEQTGGESNTVSTERMTEHILEIARNVAGQSQNQMVDMAFIVDGSRGMMGRISTLEDTLFYVEEVFDEELIDSRFWFQRLDAGANISVSPFASDIFSSRAWFQKLRLTPGDSARCYGLDAILQTLREVNFRPEASKHLLVVSHSSLRTVWDVRGAEDKMVKQIIRECNNDQIYIHVIGLSEPEPLRLAIGTGGKLYPISNSHNNAVKFLKPADLDRSILKTEGIFGLTAKHIAETATQSTDIIFLFDSSFSMEAKAEKMCRGVDEMVNVLHMGGVNHRFGVIRFWAASGGGQSIVLLTKPPISANQVKQLFRIPKRGDEHLLDAVVEGVPKLRTSKDRKLVLVILTDEPPSSDSAKGYTVEQAVEVCRREGAQVNVIGASSMRNDLFQDRMRGDMIRVVREKTVGNMRRSNPSAATFQNRVPFEKSVTETTNGVYYIMPGAAIVADNRR